MLQQYLPFTVLKRVNSFVYCLNRHVATVLTVYGIETRVAEVTGYSPEQLQQYLPFTVLKLFFRRLVHLSLPQKVATVLTVYGIETYYEDD